MIYLVYLEYDNGMEDAILTTFIDGLHSLTDVNTMNCSTSVTLKYQRKWYTRIKYSAII